MPFANLSFFIVGQEESRFDEHAAVFAPDPSAHAARPGVIVADHVRGRCADQAALDPVTEYVVVRWDDVIGSHVRQQFRQDIAQLHIVQVSLLDSFLAHAMSCMTQQVRFYNKEVVRPASKFKSEILQMQFIELQI